LFDICDRYRGEEINKAGLFWECPSCATPTVPGKKEKGGAYRPKLCSACAATLDALTASYFDLKK
jgi:hypothetical protein